MRFLLALYPAAWRERYEDEFLAVLEKRSLSPFDVVDIALGALDTRLHPRDLAIEFVGRRSSVMNARFAGWAAVAGGVLSLLSIAGFALGAVGGQMEVGRAIFALAYPPAAIALLVALVGLSAVQGRHRPVLVWSAVLIPIAGVLVSLVGHLMWFALPNVSDLGFYVWFPGFLGLLVGSALFGASTIAVGVFSRGASASLLAGGLLVVVVVVALATNLLSNEPNAVGIAIVLVDVALFSIGWMWLGYAAATHGAATTTQPGSVS